MKIEFMLGVMLTIQILLFIFQVSVTTIGTENGITTPTFFNYQTSILSSYDTGNQTYVLTSDVGGQLPNGVSSVSGSTGTPFTDFFNTIKGWITGAGTGVKIIAGIATAVPDAIKLAGFPSYIAFSLGLLWYAIAIFLIVMMLR